ALASGQFAKQISKVVKGQTREVEALLQLYRWVEPTEPMPPSGQWAMNPQGLLALFALVRRNRPRVVVELGSGTSTVWLAYGLAANGPVGDNGSSRIGRLVSIDHEPEYADQTRAMVALHAGQIAPTEVRDAPLRPLSLGTDEFQWYSRDVFEDIREIDMLIVDGPPRRSGPLARYPAIPVLLDRLADNAIIVLDDATRKDEKQAAQRWMTEHAGITPESSPIGRLGVFRYSSVADMLQ
ncbi:MAG TPA: class I SAM-dependent methyltransferase, partial [Jiangellaceae bacterium]